MIGIGRTLAAATLCLAAWTGCQRPQPIPTPVGYKGRPVTLAVVPVQDLSGNGALNSLAMTDVLAGELAQIEQVSVVPVNQTVAVMLGQGWGGLSSARQAETLARLLNADGVLVTAVTEYDPYMPPRLGLIGEVYMVSPHARPLAGQAVSRSPAPVTTRPEPTVGPDRQVQRIFDTAQAAEQKRIRTFAAHRSADRGQWQDYLRNQQQFLRYCSWRTVVELVSEPQAAVAGPTG